MAGAAFAAVSSSAFCEWICSAIAITTIRMSAIAPPTAYITSFGGTLLISLTAFFAFSRVMTFGFSGSTERLKLGSLCAVVSSTTVSSGGGGGGVTTISLSGGISSRSEKLERLDEPSPGSAIMGSTAKPYSSVARGSAVAADIFGTEKVFAAGAAGFAVAESVFDFSRVDVVSLVEVLDVASMLPDAPAAAAAAFLAGAVAGIVSGAPGNLSVVFEDKAEASEPSFAAGFAGVGGADFSAGCVRVASAGSVLTGLGALGPVFAGPDALIFSGITRPR